MQRYSPKPHHIQDNYLGLSTSVSKQNRMKKTVTSRRSKHFNQVHGFALATLLLIIPPAAFAADPPTTSPSPSKNQSKTITALDAKVAGVVIELVLEHPELATPTGIDIDQDGAIWVASNHTHFRPENYNGPEQDQILHFDSNGKRTVFFSASENTMDLELGLSNDVFLAQRDKILRLHDDNKDIVCDRYETIIQLETEASYPHNGLSGLTWSPDGQLVFSIGENFAKKWKLIGADKRTLTGSGEGGIFSCRPDGSQLRRIAKGFWNPFGLCFRNGELFAAENDPGSLPPCRLLHIVENGDYGYQRKYGNAPQHPFVCWNGELQGTLPMMHALGEAPCGIVPFHQGLLVTSWTEHRLDYYPLTPSGESFSTKRITIAQGDRNFRPTCIASGNDHDFYFTDWVKGSYEIHGQGRVWRVRFDPKVISSWTAPDSSAPSITDGKEQDLQANRQDRLAKQKIETLLEEACVTEDAFARHQIIREVARRIKNDNRPDKLDINRLWLLSEGDRLPFLLAWKMAKPNDRDAAKQCLKHSDQSIQFESLRWIAEEEMSDLLPEVKSCLDQPKLDYVLFEAILATINTLEGKPDAEIADQESLQSLMANDRLSESVRVNLIRLIRPDPKSFGLQQWSLLREKGSAAILRELVRTVGFAGSEDANKFLVEIMSDSSVSNSIRADAISSFAPSDAADVDLLLKLAASENQSIREESLRSLRFNSIEQAYEPRLRKLQEDFPASADLIEAILDPKAMIQGRPAEHDTENWKQLLANVSSPVDLNAGRRIFSHARITNCKNCHRHSGRGNILGPDLTTLSRSVDRDRILLSLLQPSLQIDPQYHGRSLLLEDGTTFTGILLRDGGGGREVYRNLNGKEEVLRTEDIIERREASTSLMPEGLLNQLTVREIRDLVAFLSQSSPNQIATSLEQNELDERWFGDWWLDFPDGYGGWFRLRKENATSAELLWRVGSPRPVDVQRLDPLRLRLVRRNKKGEKAFFATLNDHRITISEGQSETTIASGEKCPPMPQTPNLDLVEFGEPISLFNGKNLEGWKLQPREANNGWQVIDGTLANTTPKKDFSAYGDYGNLRTKPIFGDCQLHVEFKVEENCNSGIYVNGLYEAQVVDRDSPMQGISGPGAIFGRIAPTSNAGLPGGHWQTYDITLVDRHITVVLNGTKVIDNQPVNGCTGGALSGNVMEKGPLYLQGDHTSVTYRNIWIRPRLFERTP